MRLHFLGLQTFDTIFHWIFHWCLLDFMDTADLSESASPSSPLHNAGGDTEAGAVLDLFQAGHELADTDTADVQGQFQQESHHLQFDDSAFGDGSKRRRGNPNLRADTRILCN